MSEETKKKRSLGDIKGMFRNKDESLKSEFVINSYCPDLQGKVKRLSPDIKRIDVHFHGSEITMTRYPTNSDGSPGGFVAETAKAEPTTHIAKDALVFDKAQILGKGRLLNNAIATSEAIITGTVMEDAHISDKAKVTENGIVGGKTILVGDVVVNSDIRGITGLIRNNKELESLLLQKEQSESEARLKLIRESGKKIEEAKKE
ncbi:MAG: hypothetical protein ABSD68_02950 [Candidatus Micrarchaeales archaeon]